MRHAPRLVALVAALSTAATTTATSVRAQPAPAAPPTPAPVDPYADPAPDEPPASGAASDEADPEIAEAIAASLVARARELIAAEQWADAQQLLGEALTRSPGGAAARDAQPLLDQVNAHLGIGGARPPLGGDLPSGPSTVPVPDPEPLPRPPGVEGEGGSAHAGGFWFHTAVMGALVGGFFGDAATADLTPDDGIDEETDGPIVGGAVIGALGGTAVGLLLGQQDWVTRDRVVVIDSFAAMGLAGALSLGAVMDPPESEAYSVNGIFGVAGGALIGGVVARHHDLSARRMARVDLWAAGGALTPWLIFAAADGDSADAQVAGLLSMVGMVGGAWLGFRLTSGWDARGERVSDAPTALLRRGSDGAWTVGAPGLRPVGSRVLGPTLGRGAAVDLLSGRF